MRSLGPWRASAANIAAFNIGNAFGAWVGGLTTGARLSHISPLWADAGITVAAVFVLVFVSPRLSARAGRPASGDRPRSAADAGLTPVT